MIKSCAECTSKCCKTGPGPYKKLSPEEYLEVFGLSDAYNKACKHHNLKTGHCNVWGTPGLPIECRTYVCQTREYSDLELDTIDNIEEDYECEGCGSSYMINDSPEGNDELFIVKCEICNHTNKWRKI